MKSTIWLVSLLLAKGLPEISHQRIGEFIVSTCYPGEDYTVQCLEGEVEYPVKQKWQNMAVQGIEFKQYSGGLKNTLFEYFTANNAYCFLMGFINGSNYEYDRYFRR